MRILIASCSIIKWDLTIANIQRGYDLSLAQLNQHLYVEINSSLGLTLSLAQYGQCFVDFTLFEYFPGYFLFISILITLEVLNYFWTFLNWNVFFLDEISKHAPITLLTDTVQENFDKTKNKFFVALIQILWRIIRSTICTFNNELLMLFLYKGFFFCKKCAEIFEIKILIWG